MDRQLENELYNDFEKAMDDNISKMLNDAGYNYTEAVNNSNLTIDELKDAMRKMNELDEEYKTYSTHGLT